MRDTLRLVTSVALVEILVVMGLDGASPAAAASINGPYTYDQAVALGFLEPIAQKLPWCKKADPGFGTVDGHSLTNLTRPLVRRIPMTSSFIWES